MSKYVSNKGGSRVSCWHSDPECKKLKHTSREARPGEIEYHDLTPCGRCAKPERPSHTKQDWSYQNLRGALE